MTIYKKNQKRSIGKTILFISPTGTFDNGAEIAAFNLMKYLHELGYRVINVAPKKKISWGNEYQKRMKNTGIKCYFLPYLKWWWENAPGSKIGTKQDREASYFNNIWRIRKIIKKDQVNMVITNSVNVFQGAVSAKLSKIPHMWLIHEFPKNEFSYYNAYLEFIDIYSQSIFAVEGALQQKLSMLFPNRTIGSFIPFTDLASDSQQIKSAEAMRIISVGRLTPRKNQMELIKAFRLLKNPNVELLFIGPWDSEYKEECCDYIQKYNLENISFVGECANPWDLVTNQDICVLTSLTETFGLVYVEAVLNGIPVIFSNNDGFLSASQLLGAGSQYQIGHTAELANQINEYLNAFSERKQQAVEAAVKAQKIYTLENAYKNILVEICEENRFSKQNDLSQEKFNCKKYLYEPVSFLYPIYWYWLKVKYLLIKK